MGVSARMLVASPEVPVENGQVRSVGGVKWQLLRYVEKLGTFIRVRDRSLLFRFSDATIGLCIAHHPWIHWADVIHIHWVQQSFLSFSGLHDLLQLRDKQFFWSLHDLWPLTGGCHSPYVIRGGETELCDRFLHGCGCCPLLGSHRSDDHTARHFARKSELPLERVHFLGVSHSLVGQAQASPLVSQVSYLPNFYDPQLFHPGEKVAEKNVRLLFVAARLDDPVKGLDLLRQVLEECCLLSETFRRRAKLTCIGTLKDPDSLRHWPIDVEHHDSIGQESLIDYYRSADLTLSTSRHETFGLTLLESLACGTPVCAFAVGGIPDIVRDGQNGSLVKPYDTSEMAQRLVEFFDQRRTYTTAELVQSVAPFAEPTVLRRLMALYGL